MKDICIKHELEKEFVAGIPRYDIWKKYPEVKHNTIRQYHWNWKQSKKKKQIKDNPILALHQLIKDIKKPITKTPPKHIEKSPDKVETNTVSENKVIPLNEKKNVEWKPVERRERYDPFDRTSL